MRNLILFLFTLISVTSLYSQTPEEIGYNLGFELINKPTKNPTKWLIYPNPEYSIGIDSIIKYNGKYSLKIESLTKQTENSTGFIRIEIPADFECNQIEVKVKMKLSDVSDSNADFGVILSGDRKNLLIKSLDAQKLRGTIDWKEYSITVPFNTETKSYIIAIQFFGKGKIWYDDFQFLIDGDNYFTSKKRFGYSVRLDKEFDNGSLISIKNINKHITSNLTILGKVWGFLKYYHPQVTGGHFNWDYELFRIMPDILIARNPKERDQTLSKWINRLGPIDSLRPEQSIDSTKVKQLPDLKWIENKQVLSEDLVQQFDLIERSKRSNYNYYVDVTMNSNPIFKNENGYNNMRYPDVGFRLLSLFRFWNIIQYFYPYKYLTDENWENVLPEFIPKFINVKNETEYRTVVLELLSHVKDTHVNISADDEILNNILGRNFIPLEVAFIENKVVVINFLDAETEKNSILKRGDIIMAINGENVKTILKNRLPLTPASNYPTQLRNISRDLLRTNNKQLKIKYESVGSTKTAIIDCIPYDILTYYNAFLIPKGSFSKLLTNDIGYINLGCKRNDDLVKVMTDFKDTKGIIIDLRFYPNGNILDNLAELLMPEPLNYVKLTSVSIQTPGLFSFGRELTIGKTNPSSYKGKIAILVNANSQSKAEFYAMGFRAIPNSVIIGNTTAGSDGDISPFKLPGGITTMISGLGVYYPDGTETQRIGIIPDIVVNPTIKGIEENRDELLESAIKVLTK